MARDALYGIHVSESENVQVSANLAEGNDAGGIRFDTLLERSRNIVVRDNLVRNNGGPGLQIAGGVGADVQMNSEADNGSSPR